MKTIYLARHAKASMKDPDSNDIHRPLLEKGKKRTKHIIDFLHEKKIKVDYMVCSHALRAKETATIYARALDFPPCDIRIDRLIYQADADALINQVFDLPDNIDSIMIVGHNPGITNLTNQLISNSIDPLPASGIVSISFDCDRWEKVFKSSHTLNFIVYPSILKHQNHLVLA